MLISTQGKKKMLKTAVDVTIALEVLKIFYTNQETKYFFQFDIIINTLVSSFRFIWIPMLWVSNQYKYSDSQSVGIDFRRQKLRSTPDSVDKSNPRAIRLKGYEVMIIPLSALFLHKAKKCGGEININLHQLSYNLNQVMFPKQIVTK